MEKKKKEEERMWSEESRDEVVEKMATDVVTVLELDETQGDIVREALRDVYLEGFVAGRNDKIELIAHFDDGYVADRDFKRAPVWYKKRKML